MQITLFSFISALLWSSLLIIVIYLVRRTRFRPHFGVLTMVLLYLFCAARLLLPLEFPHTVIVSDSVVYPRIYSFLARKPDSVTHLPVGLLFVCNLAARHSFSADSLRAAVSQSHPRCAASQAMGQPHGFPAERDPAADRPHHQVRGHIAANIESAFA